MPGRPSFTKQYVTFCYEPGRVSKTTSTQSDEGENEMVKEELVCFLK